MLLSFVVVHDQSMLGIGIQQSPSSSSASNGEVIQPQSPFEIDDRMIVIFQTIICINLAHVHIYFGIQYTLF